MTPIKQIRLDHELSQIEMATMLGVTQGALSKIENGTLEPTLRMLHLLMVNFEVNLNEFIVEFN